MKDNTELREARASHVVPSGNTRLSPSLTSTVTLAAFTERRWDSLVSALAALSRQTCPPLETILVIDHNPELLDRATKAFPDISVIPNDYQQGCSGVRNTAIARARGDIVCFIDDDAEADERWLEAIMAPYSDAEVVAVGGDLLPNWVGRRPGWFPDEFLWIVSCSYRGLPETRSEVRNVFGANMSFRRSVFCEAGLFREEFSRVGNKPFGFEETEMCVRASNVRPGNKVVYEPAARALHRVPPERLRWGYFIRYAYYEGVSKARMERIAGGDSLSQERAYLLKALSTGILKGLYQSVKGDWAGMARSCAIVVGIVAGASGYLRGQWYRESTSVAEGASGLRDGHEGAGT